MSKTAIPVTTRPLADLSGAGKREWISDDGTIHAAPECQCSIEALRGNAAKPGGGATARLLADRHNDGAVE